MLAPVLLCLAAQGYATSFDGGTAGWLFSPASGQPRWAVDATPAAFPFGPSRSGNSLNFNNGVDYAGPAAGIARSPSILLTGLSNPVLEFWCNYETETRGTDFDRRYLEVWSASGGGQTLQSRWRMASVGYSFDRTAGLPGIGPGPCSEAYDDLETGTPVSTWHLHRVFLDPAWPRVYLRFVFWSVDDLRNGYSGWAIDDLSVADHPTAAPAGWPDLRPDDDTEGLAGFELDTCETRAGDRISWSWGSSNEGDAGVHLIVGDHPLAVLDETFLFLDPVHGHRHLSQYVDFALWKQQAFGFQKLRRGPKRSFCLADVVQVVGGAPPYPFPPNCNGPFEGISYGWQDIYPIDTPGQDLDVSGLATGTDYHLIGVTDPLNRFRETDETNQVDQIHFDLPGTVDTQVTILDRGNPWPPTASLLSIATATVGVFQAAPSVNVTGTGFDTTLVPVLYDDGTGVEEAPFYTIVDGTEIEVAIPGGLGTIASIDLIRADGQAASLRIGGATGKGVAFPQAAVVPFIPDDDDDDDGLCGATGLEFLLPLLPFLIRRRR